MDLTDHNDPFLFHISSSRWKAFYSLIFIANLFYLIQESTLSVEMKDENQMWQ